MKFLGLYQEAAMLSDKTDDMDVVVLVNGYHEDIRKITIELICGKPTIIIHYQEMV